MGYPHIFGRAQLFFNNKTSKRQWSCTTFTDFISEFGGLVVTVYAGLKVMTSVYHEFAKDQAMVGATLYGETSVLERTNRRTSVVLEASTAKQTFEEHVRGRQEFKVSFCAKIFYSTILSCCCCCFKSKFKAQIDKYR